jgi:mitogen-activated protein kinase 1/3
MLCSAQYTEISDIWSLGCLAVELITGKVMFDEANYINQIKIIIEKLGLPEPEDL